MGRYSDVIKQAATERRRKLAQAVRDGQACLAKGNAAQDGDCERRRAAQGGRGRPNDRLREPGSVMRTGFASDV